MRIYFDELSMECFYVNCSNFSCYDNSGNEGTDVRVATRGR